MGKVFVCQGSCHGIATLEQHEQGAISCAAKTCELHGKPLKPMEQCPECSIKSVAAGAPCVCPDCRLM
ncbi:MAG: hypothetical protein Q7S23_02990 [bacterium]|nr:hypothetical protein [bacterium]